MAAKPYIAFGKLVTHGIKRSAGDKSLTTTQKEIAARLSYSTGTLYKWRRGESLPTPQTVVALARLFIEAWSADKAWITRFLKKGLPDYPAPVEAVTGTLFPKSDNKSVYYSCFICYAGQDQEFAEQLHHDLRQQGVQCWFALKDMKIGAKIRPTIHQSIQAHDKVLLIFSHNSINSYWVENEVEAAFEEEKRRNDTILLPIRLDDTVMQTGEAWAATIRYRRYIGDFRRWQNKRAYRQSLKLLLNNLQIDGAPRSKSVRPAAIEPDTGTYIQGRIQSLQKQLIRYYETLNELEEQAAEYGPISVPTPLRNEIKAAKRKIDELEEELDKLRN